MRSRLVAMAAAAFLVTGCSAVGLGDSGPGADSEATRSTPSTPAPDTTTREAPRQRSNGSSAACDEIVAGIDAFNESDYESTVEHFEKAVPLAEAEDDGSDEAELLIAAVRYYAELAPEDYPQAANTSPEFARWKAVTLGRCVTGSDQPSPTTTGDVV